MNIGRISTLDGAQSVGIAYTLHMPGRRAFADGEAVPADGEGFPPWLMNPGAAERLLRLADGRRLKIFIRSTTGRGFNAPPPTDAVAFFANAGFEE